MYNMAAYMKLLVVCMCVLQAYAFDEEDYKRALKAFHLTDESLEKRVACVGLTEECDAVIYRCCGTLQCHWEDGYSMIKKGNCVECVPEFSNCQRDGQCCNTEDEALYCDRGGNPMLIDGLCRKYRRSGECYKDSQCVNDCVKKWYQIVGECS